MMNAKRVVCVFFLLVSLGLYFLLMDGSGWTTNRFSSLPLHHSIAPTSVSKLDKCMDNFDFHIVDQRAPLANQSSHPISFFPYLRTPCWFEVFNAGDVNRLASSPYLQLKNERRYAVEGLQQLRFALQQRLFSGSKHRNIRLRCLPFFVIIGQAKCGTTDLFRKLELHPQIEMSLLKEPDWWTRSVPGQGGKFSVPRPIPFSAYVDLNGLAAMRLEEQLSAAYCQVRNVSRTRQSVIGEGSVATLSDPTWRLKSSVNGHRPPGQLSNAAYLHWVNPQARIIVILRDPVHRLISDYLFFDKTDLVSPSDFHHRVTHSLNLFTSCKKWHGEHFCVNDKKILKQLTVGVHRGLYSVYLEDWLSIFARDRILIIRTEDYARDEIETLTSAFNFLQLDKLSSSSEMDIRKMRIRNKTKKEMEPVWNSTLDLLRQFYAPYNQRLAQMMRDDRFLWN